MPQLDLNIFVPIAWWLVINFFVFFLGLMVVLFPRIIASEKALTKYRNYKLLQLARARSKISSSQNWAYEIKNVWEQKAL